jgi:hypothetical protein
MLAADIATSRREQPMPQSAAKIIKLDRRKRRSERRDQAVAFYLDGVRAQQGIDAVGVATEDGLLVAGSGPVDLESLAAHAAAGPARALRWNQSTLHVHRFKARGSTLLLASSGKAVSGREVLERLTQIIEG